MDGAPANSFLWGRRGTASLVHNGQELFTGVTLLRPFRRVIHVPHSTRVMGGVVKEEIITARFPLRVPVHYLGLAQQRLTRVYGPGPGAPVGVLKIGSFSTLNLCTGSRSLAGGQADQEQLKIMQGTEDGVLTNDQKPEGQALGSRQGPCREACEGPARLAPGKLPPLRHRSSTAASLPFWPLLLDAWQGTMGRWS